jgi:DNA-binding MarR family transcriptional regulator/GNAT superfamily N-acetyltransferase
MTATEVLRRFNRTYTQRIGALDESFLGLGLPLGASRLVFEIGTAGATVRDLRARLGLDSGQLARQLRRLEDDGLVTVAPDPGDRRRRTARLTSKGRSFRARLDHRSEQLAQQLVAPLTQRQRDRLTEALATADLLVRAATVDIRTVDPEVPAARTAIGRYFAELDRRFPDGFDPGPASSEDMSAAQGGAFVLAISEGAPVACGGVRDLGDGVGEIKRMWVHDDWRGAGLGSRLLRHLEEVSRGLGHRLVRLDTNRTLVEAVSMYERSGYRHIERYNDNPYAQAFFEKALTSGPG